VIWSQWADEAVDAGSTRSGSYRSVSIGDITSRYVQEQQRVEAAGDLRSSGDKLLLNVNHISAMVPLVVDASALAPEVLRNIRMRCAAALGHPGCRQEFAAQLDFSRIGAA